MGYDFSGYATKNDVTCGDGRIIRRDAFKSCDGDRVSLVWKHMHDKMENVLGHADLENRPDGVYAYCSFNDRPQGREAKALVQHGDLTHLSIYANHLTQRGNEVLHGIIREVSLVHAGANPEARIEAISIRHEDDTFTELDDEAIIYSGIKIVLTDDDDSLAHSDDNVDEEENDDVIKHEDSDVEDGMDQKNVQRILNSMTDEQKNLLYVLVGSALEDDGDEAEHGDLGDDMHHNVFDSEKTEDKCISHDELNEYLAEARRVGNLKDTFLEHGIENLEVLLPDFHDMSETPTWVKRETEWVKAWWGALKKTPFARIRTRWADITEYEARARGYITGNQKIEEFFKVAARTTTPTTVTKLQKLHRDDLIDSVDIDVVAWMRQEMRIMLEEELAVATLIGDGRPANDVSKINEDNIRPIYTDDDMFCMHEKVTIPENATDVQIAKTVIRASLLTRKRYKGTGRPWFVTTNDVLVRMLLAEDQIGHRLYKTEAELAAAMRVERILEVPVLEGAKRTAVIPAAGGVGTTTEVRTLLGLLVNPGDYVIGADKGGAVTMFDDFNLDFNKYEYLIETRCSGALRDPYTAIALETTDELPFVFGPRSGDYSTATMEKDSYGWPKGYPQYGTTGTTGETGEA